MASTSCGSVILLTFIYRISSFVERENDTIKNQYLKRWGIGKAKELSHKLADALKGYNEQRPHHSLSGMSPLQYEKYLETTENNKRSKMTIYTVKLNSENRLDTQPDLFKQS
ncbi:MAG: integrase core domain-containing protein [Agriterribacter sp.]